jgi:predicted GIY-YIG superfamily endonuclease
MTQILLFPDPRPLVERLGPEFFQSAPQEPGVYLMRDHADAVLYVGKAKNLRKRLASYRVANPDRMPRRHLRMLRAVERIELQPCADEPCALAQEARLLRTLRPPFNRAGTWPGMPRLFAWRTTEKGLDLAVTQAAWAGWHNYGPLGASAFPLRASLARLLWCALHPEGGLAGLPEGWFNGRHREISTVPTKHGVRGNFDDSSAHLRNFFSGQAEGFNEWILACTASLAHPFDRAVRDADLETVSEVADRKWLIPGPEIPEPQKL